MLVKEKKELHANQYGWVNLKRWSKEEGFYIELKVIQKILPQIYIAKAIHYKNVSRT